VPPQKMPSKPADRLRPHPSGRHQFCLLGFWGVPNFGDEWLLPGVDALTKRFFTAGKLVFQACAKCGHVQHPPTDVCGACQAFEFGERESAGLGRIESAIVVHHPQAKYFDV